MSQGPDRPGTYNPLEDTGDWPFRESAPPPVEGPRSPDASVAAAERPFDREQDAEPAPTSSVPERGEEPRPEPSLEPDRSQPEADAEQVPGPEPEPEPPAAEAAPEPEAEGPPEADRPPEVAPEPEPERETALEREAVPAAGAVALPVASDQHAAGEFQVPAGPEVLSGGPNGFRRTVAVVVSRFNADVTNRLLESAIDALVDAHVAKESITVVPVPGAFELPLAAMALAKTRRFSCVVGLGCVIRGETPHFDFVAGEAASGLQLAAIETGVPVSFGLLTCETREQAEARIGKGAEAARAALEMADLFTQVRTRSARAG